MLRIHSQILHCWKPVKQTFKSYHESHTGLLNIADFRQVSYVQQIIVRKLQLSNLSFLMENFLKNGTELEHINSVWLFSVTLALTITHSKLFPHMITVPCSLRS